MNLLKKNFHGKFNNAVIELGFNLLRRNKEASGGIC